MSFALTAKPGSIRLESNHILFATLKDTAGREVASSMDLDKHIENVNGSLAWDSGAFSRSANVVDLDLSGFPEQVLLVALLEKEDGSSAQSHLNLNERIANMNGHLEF
ncbi:Cyanovirin-N [Rhizoctonia solani]|nr:Cyanovirin-N [Rhizoctonia solani]